jgi:hypothetical protein
LHLFIIIIVINVISKVMYMMKRIPCERINELSLLYYMNFDGLNE